MLSGCRPHACEPMSRSTIHTIHSILSGAFEAAHRWEWVDFNPAASAKPPTMRQKKRTATPPSAVVNVIQQARLSGQKQARSVSSPIPNFADNLLLLMTGLQ